MKAMRSFFLLAVVILTMSVSLAQDDQETEENKSPSAAMTVEGNGFFIDVYSPVLLQGRAGLIGLRGEEIHQAQAQIFSRSFDFFYVPELETWFSFIVARMEQPIRAYELIISIQTTTSDIAETTTAVINVANGRFIQQDVILPPDEGLEELLDPEIEASELAQIFELADPVQERMWDERGFIPPLGSELTSPFGAVRVFNDSLDSIHTGWDFRAEIGELMVATAGGRVAFAGSLPLRGNYILIDHGQGVYSGYAHLSVSFLTQGQFVHQGQMVGRVGSTGRSSSAHAHIEFIVHGEWVDAADFIRMYVP